MTDLNALAINQYHATNPDDRVNRTFVRFTCQMRAPLDFLGNQFLESGNLVDSVPFAVSEVALCNPNGVVIDTLSGITVLSGAVTNPIRLVDNSIATAWDETNGNGSRSANLPYFDLVYPGNVEVVGYYIHPSTDYPLPKDWKVERMSPTDTDWVLVDHQSNTAGDVTYAFYGKFMRPEGGGTVFAKTLVTEMLLQLPPYQPPANVPDGGGITDLSAMISSGTISTISVTWKDTLVNTYVVERAVEDGPFEVISNTSKSRSATFANMTPGTVYTFRVRRLSSGGGALVSITTPGTAPASLPSIPTNLTVKGMTSTQTRVRFSYSGNDEDWFEIQRTTPDSSGVNITVATVGTNTTTWHDEGRTQGIVYSYRVRAKNKNGPSDWSAWVEGTPLTAAEVTQAALVTKMETGVPLTLNETCTVLAGDPITGELGATVLNQGGRFKELRAHGFSRSLATSLSLLMQRTSTASEYDNAKFNQAVAIIMANSTNQNLFATDMSANMVPSIDELASAVDTTAEQNAVIAWATHRAAALGMTL